MACTVNHALLLLLLEYSVKQAGYIPYIAERERLHHILLCPSTTTSNFKCVSLSLSLSSPKTAARATSG